MKKIDNYIRFFNDQAKEIQKDYKKILNIPMKQLFREGIIIMAFIDAVNTTNGHLIIKFKKKETPRLKVMKNFTILTPKVNDLGPISNWDITFEQFNNTKGFHQGLSDIFPMYFVKKNDDEYDYVSCSSVALKEYTAIQNVIMKGASLRILLFDPMPPTKYFSNLAHFTYTNSGDPLLAIEPKMSYEDWHPEELAYNPDNPTSMVDRIVGVLSEDKCCIVQGPPGTGKSYTIANIISKYLDEGKSVCVTTMANKGLMELACQKPLKPYMEKKSIFKTRLCADEKRDNPFLNEADKNLLVSQGSLLLTTNYNLSRVYDPNKDPALARPSYDLVVIEEASQSFLSTIVAFKKLGKECLIVGDPMQLPPIVSGKDKIEYKLWNVQQQCDGLTTFALGTNYKSFRITTTFRLTPKSAKQTSIFYGDSFRSVQKDVVDFSLIKSPLFPKEGGSILTCTRSGVDSICSKSALKLMHYIVDLITNTYPEMELAIITPFRDTVKVLQKEFYTENQQLDLTVETIDRIQGMTVDYAILYIPMDRCDFALTANRFNVATSRSRSTTLIISDLDLKIMSSVPRISQVYLNNCDVVEVDYDLNVINKFVDEETNSITTISNEVASIKVVGKTDLSKFERKKVEIIDGKINYFIIDTNVFVNCPSIISRIEKEYPVVLAAKVVDELDKLKIKLSAKDQKNVQDALRSINKQMQQRDIRMELADINLLPSDFDKNSPDNMILSVALKYIGDNSNPILLTSDNGLMIKANGLKIKTISLKEFLQERRY